MVGVSTDNSVGSMATGVSFGAVGEILTVILF